MKFAALALAAATSVLAQTATQLNPPPTPPILVHYSYWPTQYLQFVTGPELPYSMFMLEANTEGKQPVYHAALTAKDGSRTNYSNIDAVVEAFKAGGEPSYKAAIEVESDGSEKVGAVTTVRFTLADGKPLEFRFVQGSEISAQGSGVQPLPQVPVPVFAIRELGAVAGEGTALKIGDSVSAAEVWTEISHPPYFVGYRGAITSGAHLLVLPGGKEIWTVSKSPAALAAGNTWELTGDHGTRTLRIDKVDGPHVSIAGTDSDRPSTRFLLDATRAGDSWTVDRLRYQPVKDGDKHAVTLSMTANGTLDITAGKKLKVASGTLTTVSTPAEGTPATVTTASAPADGKPSPDSAAPAAAPATSATSDRTTTLKLTAPTWIAGHGMTEQTTTTATTVTLTAAPTAR